KPNALLARDHRDSRCGAIWFRGREWSRPKQPGQFKVRRGRRTTMSEPLRVVRGVWIRASQVVAQGEDQVAVQRLEPGNPHRGQDVAPFGYRAGMYLWPAGDRRPVHAVDIFRSGHFQRCLTLLRGEAE